MLVKEPASFLAVKEISISHGGSFIDDLTDFLAGDGDKSNDTASSSLLGSKSSAFLIIGMVPFIYNLNTASLLALLLVFEGDVLVTDPSFSLSCKERSIEQAVFITFYIPASFSAAAVA